MPRWIAFLGLQPPCLDLQALRRAATAGGERAAGFVYWIEGPLGLAEGPSASAAGATGPILADRRLQVVTGDTGLTQREALDAELRAARALRLRRPGDAERILAAYELWVEDCVLHLAGAFAFGLWDRRQRRLLLARDRGGSRPLFVVRNASGVFGGSDGAALEAFASPGAPVAEVAPGHRILAGAAGIRVEAF